jgi:hypothetical protein
MRTYSVSGARCCAWAAGCLVVLLTTASASAAALAWTSTSGIKLSARDGSNTQPLMPSAYTKEILFHEPTAQWYWMEYSAIKRADFDGSNVQTVISDSFTSANTDFCIDSVNGRIYWTNNNGQLRRANLDGSGAATLDSGLAGASAIAVDPVHSKLFWIHYSSNITIYAGDLAGNGKTTIGFLSSLWSMADMDVDPASQQIYWVGTSSFRNEIIQRHGYTYNYNATTLLDTELGVARNLILDPVTDTMVLASGGQILELNKNGTGLTTLYSGGSGTPYHVAIAQIPEPATMALIGLGGLFLARRR